MPLRKINADEERLLNHLVKISSVKLQKDWKEKLMVEPMDDGGMGSLVLYPQGKITGNRMFGKTVSECGFKDADRADVIASLNVDENNELFELDIWKTTFDPLKRIPETFE